jgi:hypothetical protein
MAVKFRNTICPPPPQLSLHTLQKIHPENSGIQDIHEGANLKFYIPEFFNFKLLIPEYSPI